MSLLKCHECTTEVSTEAKACPKCGAKVKKPAGLTAWLIVGLIGTGIVAASITEQEKTAALAAAEAAKTPEQRAADVAKKEAEDKQFYAAAGLAKTIKDAARDPDSLVMEALYVNDDTSVACAQYRARNGFGGMNRELLVVTKTKTSQSTASWNRHCTKNMKDMLWVVTNSAA